jgi:urate oxidase
MRRNQFTVDAESVQGNAGASVTFNKLLVGEYDEWFDPTSGATDLSVLRSHLVSWEGFEDDNGNALPNPPDISSLYLDETKELCKLLLRGPSELSGKNL